MLAKNRFVDNVHALPKSGQWRQLLMLFRKYDYTLATNPSDRTTICAVLTGKKTIGFTYFRKQGWWKSMVLNQAIKYDDSNHVVHQMLELLEPLGITKIPEMTVDFDSQDMVYVKKCLPFNRYILLHPYSSRQYKYWSVEKWAELANSILSETDCVPVFTTTGSDSDRDYLSAILASAPEKYRYFEEPMSFAQLTAALSNSVAYVGIDTMVTHLAAATGIPTVAIFGPTYTRYWAPWPKECQDASPFRHNRGVQKVNNVTVVQKDWECVPCNKPFCRISTREKFECLEATEPTDVFSALMSNLSL